MDKIKSALVRVKDLVMPVWEMFLDGVDYTASWIAAYPKITLLLFVVYVAVRQ